VEQGRHVAVSHLGTPASSGKEWIMLRIIDILIGRRTKSRPVRVTGSIALLRLETLEDRLVPSTMSLGATPGGGIALPETPVHGYKWRPRWPRIVEAAGDQSGQAIQPQDLSTQVATRLSTSAVVADVLFGAGEGPQARITPTGLVLHHPEGPLPTDIAFGVR
jgi:hypothetical protein